jgi:hypothetical protein
MERKEREKRKEKKRFLIVGVCETSDGGEKTTFERRHGRFI